MGGGGQITWEEEELHEEVPPQQSHRNRESSAIEGSEKHWSRGSRRPDEANGDEATLSVIRLWENP